MKGAHKSLSDTELFELLRKGDPDAFDIIYERYFFPLINTAFKRLHLKEDAQEVVQDVFVQLYMKRNQIEHATNLSAYLHTLLRNKIIDRFREQLSLKKYQNRLIKMHPLVAEEAATSNMDSKLLKKKINDAIEELPQKCREVFLLSRVGLLSHQNIAKELDISVSTVEKHIIKALKFMRKKVEKHQLNTAFILGKIAITSIAHFY